MDRDFSVSPHPPSETRSSYDVHAPSRLATAPVAHSKSYYPRRRVWGPRGRQPSCQVGLEGAGHSASSR
eukprot:14660348-Alexandrium_andersonii.AAC.1